jgi:acyl-CoA thioester hydrolase
MLPEPRLSVPLKIYYFDTDAAGVVHNVAYLRLVEVARTALAEHLGWSLAEMHRTGKVPVVTRTEIDYLKPARLGDDLVVESALLGMERLRFFLQFEMRRSLDQVLLAKCQQTMVTVQLPAGRPQPVPTKWREAYPHLCLEV